MMTPAADSREWQLELALRKMRRFANRVATNAAYARLLPLVSEAYEYQDLANEALGYCGCPSCSEAEDARLGRPMVEGESHATARGTAFTLPDDVVTRIEAQITRIDRAIATDWLGEHA